ncbi:3794_t:CDS:2 [Acaulospora colombiana]|uniref:3794_t:CDS:1 n=1 Tax=Acaulospora colombiana TaxID=27376 RepID=A0ACA9K2X2_9GLOM|nr:3794_t:CDS:2 [Acaulospora colombiana]
MGNILARKRTAKKRPKNIDDKLLFNEENEIDRTQVEHHMYRTLWGGNFLAPVRDILVKGDAIVLDFGDLNGSLPFGDNQFDFVHTRFKYLNYTKEQWEKKVVKELVRVLKPGGWIEMFELECDGINNGPISKHYIQLFREAALKKNIDPDLVFHLPGILASTEGIDSSTICHASKVVPMGSWGGKIGELVQHNTTEFVRKINVVLRMPETKTEDLVAQQIEELNYYKTSIRMHKFYARKAFTSRDC